MANIRVDVDKTIRDGSEVTFIAPCDCTIVTGLNVYYPNLYGDQTNSIFTFKDAHGNDLRDIDLFAKDAYVKVILNTTLGIAYLQNADTNKYLEGRFKDLDNKIPIITYGPESEGFPENPVEGQIHIMYKDITEDNVEAVVEE